MAARAFVSRFDEFLPLRDLQPQSDGVVSKEEDQWALSLPAVTMPALFASSAEKFADRLALAVKRPVSSSLAASQQEGENGGKEEVTLGWQQWTWSEYYADAECAGRALLSLGLTRFGCVSILGFNAPEWAFAFAGAQLAGGVPVGIYITNSPEAVHYVVDHSESEFVFVDEDYQLAKIVQIADRLKHVRAVVQWDGVPAADAVAQIKKAGIQHVLSWEEFMAFGKAAASRSELQKTLEARAAEQKPEDCATMIYTSGTTGNPKGVMLSHDNCTWTAIVITKAYDFLASDINVSYLPLSHIAAQLLDIIGPMSAGSSTWFAQPDALKGSLVDTLKEVRPTVFFGVPRVWEKIYEKMRAVGRANTGVKKMIGDWAKSVGAQGTRSLEAGGQVPWGWWLASTLVFRNVKAALGLDRTRYFASAAAPLSNEVIDYFASLDVPIKEVYGMSECSGPQTGNRLLVSGYRFGTVGARIAGTHMKIADDGEICFQGRNTFMGYYKQPELSAEAIDDEGWLHSGDIGTLIDGKWLKITGRKKELLITAGGENIAPVLIEDAIKKELAGIVGNVMVVGDLQKFLTAVVTLASVPKDPNSLAEGEYPLTNDLVETCIEACREGGSSATTVSEGKEDPVLYKLIEDGIKRANKLAISNAHHVQKFVILPKDFTLEGNELTPTMKLKRRIVLDLYLDDIKQMYGDDWKS